MATLQGLQRPARPAAGGIASSRLTRCGAPIGLLRPSRPFAAAKPLGALPQQLRAAFGSSNGPSSSSSGGGAAATSSSGGGAMSGACGRPARSCGCDGVASASGRGAAFAAAPPALAAPRARALRAAAASWQHGPSQQQQQQQHHHHHHQQQQQRPAAPAPAARAAAPAPARRRAPAPAPATFAAGAGDDGLLGRSPDFVEEATGWRRRWTVVLLCFAAFMLCNMDRVNMSVAILPMSQQFAWDSKTVGLVQSSFFWGYLLTQVLGGIWADKFGGKVVLGFGVIWWSLATALTPIAAAAGLPALLAARALMGIGEGVAMPAMNNMLSRWVPVAERSRSLALVYSGMFIGSILGLGLSPHMIAALGWPSVFYVFGSMGVVWFMAWRNWAASTPREDPLISPEEQAYILANTSSSNKARRIPWAKLLSRREVWAIIVCHFCHNWGTFILLTWMPTYYNQVLGLDVMASGIFSVLPWMTMAVSANVGGWIADTLVTRGVSVTTVRKVMQTIGFLGPAFFLSQLSSVTNVGGAVACMMGAQGFDAFSQSGLYSNHQDIGPKYAGVLLGLSNTAGVLAGVLGSLATGYILAHGTWADVWRVAVALYLVGTVIWNLFSTGERIFD